MQHFLRAYGVQTIINFVLFEVDGVDFRVDAVDGNTDCTIRKDQGADTTCVNDFVDEGIGYSLTLTATEMEAAELHVYIVDSATKVWLDEILKIETYGNASAQHAMDFDTTVPTVAEIQTEMEENGASILDTLQDRITAAVALVSELDKVPKSDGAVSWNATALTAIEGEVDDALIAQRLDHLVNVADADDVVDDSIIARLAAIGGDWSTFVEGTDSLQALSAVLDAIHLHTEAIAVTGSALTQIAGSNVLATGTQSSGTYVSTHLADEIEHVITVAASEIDIYYQFDIGASGVPVAVHGEGWLQEGAPPGGDVIDLYAYNWGDTTFELVQMDVFTGIITAGPADAFTHTLLARHVGTGGNEGLVRIQFQAASLEAGTTLNIDQLFISYAEAISAELAKVPKSDSNVIHNDTALAAIQAEMEENGASILDTLRDRVTAAVALASICTEARLAELDAGALPTDIAALPTAAEVNAEVLDVMNIDTFAEPAQGAPGATISLAAKIGFMYKNWRNKKTSTATQESLLGDDAVTVDSKSVLSDNGTVFTKGEVATGP